MDVEGEFERFEKFEEFERFEEFRVPRSVFGFELISLAPTL